MSILLPNDGGMLLQEPDYFGQKMFRKAVLAEFPHLATQIDEDQCIHGVMAILNSECNEAIAASDFEFLGQVFALLERIISIPNVDLEIENAIAISFLTAPELRESPNGERTFTLMPDRIKKIILEAERKGL